VVPVVGVEVFLVELEELEIPRIHPHPKVVMVGRVVKILSVIKAVVVAVLVQQEELEILRR
jgi:hypothetical protein